MNTTAKVLIGTAVIGGAYFGYRYLTGIYLVGRGTEDGKETVTLQKKSERTKISADTGWNDGDGNTIQLLANGELQVYKNGTLKMQAHHSEIPMGSRL